MAREFNEGRGSGDDGRRAGNGGRERGDFPEEFDYDRRREHHGDERPHDMGGDRRGSYGRSGGGGYGSGAGYRDEDYGRERGGGGGRSASGQPPYGRDFGGRDFGTAEYGSNENAFGGFGQGSGGTYESERYRGDGGGYGQGRREFGGGYGSGSRYLGAYGDRDRSGAGFRGQGGYGDRHHEDRSWWDRATDEVSSWFGGEEGSERHHRGRGPKGYKRSDERITEDINDRLSDDHMVDASDVEVSVSGGEVTLSGTVDSRFAKRRAEDICESVSGVSHCQNNLRVRQQSTSTSETHATGQPGQTGQQAAAPGGMTSSPAGGIGTSQNRH
jgi:osmotically-inducible protein OsmY